MSLVSTCSTNVDGILLVKWFCHQICLFYTAGNSIICAVLHKLAGHHSVVGSNVVCTIQNQDVTGWSSLHAIWKQISWRRFFHWYEQLVIRKQWQTTDVRSRENHNHQMLEVMAKSWRGYMLLTYFLCHDPLFSFPYRYKDVSVKIVLTALVPLFVILVCSTCAHTNALLGHR